MFADEGNLSILLELDRHVRLMASAPGTDKLLVVVRAYLDSWSEARIHRLRGNHMGWAPFDEFLRPYPVSGVDDVRKIGGSVRIRCRDLNASGEKISQELLELDLFFFFANESLQVHLPVARLPSFSAIPLPSCLASFVLAHG